VKTLLIGMRLEDAVRVVRGSQTACCASCSREVVLSPRSIPVLTLGATVSCTRCALRAAAAGELTAGKVRVPGGLAGLEADAADTIPASQIERGTS